MGKILPAKMSAKKVVMALVALGFSAQVQAGTASRKDDGKLPDGRAAEVIILDNGKGATARILSYGATLQSFTLPDAKGRMADVILGHDDTSGYLKTRDFLGVTVGRYANRIARGQFTLDGKTYQIPTNDGMNTLHGGPDGFDRRLWTIDKVETGPSASVTMSLISPDGDQGYPGEMSVQVAYALDAAGALTITMTAQTKAPTIINMTNHALFNMSGQCSAQGALGNLLTMPASRYTPVDAKLIPTGELASVAGTHFDFRKAKPMNSGLRDTKDPQILVGRGFDHNWVLDKGVTETPQRVALVQDPLSGRAMEVLSTEPGLQMYTGNFLDGTNVGKNGCLYRMGDAYALEPQKFPDAPNHANFASARLDPGQTYRHVMILRPASFQKSQKSK